jgi:monoamine oxidase
LFEGDTGFAFDDTQPFAFEGIEVVPRFAGCMEGALHSGEAAAQQLLRRT